MQEAILLVFVFYILKILIMEGCLILLNFDRLNAVENYTFYCRLQEFEGEPWCSGKVVPW